ncbi:MAG: EAL domain-containing protein [Herminiimonas sp.]|nr:EAL domain-containing protein [Herminiimonas sp.]
MLSRETPFARNKSGEVSQILGIAHDITGRIQAEEEREMFVSLASNSKEFIGMADLEFNRFYVKALHHALERAQLQTGYSLLNYLKKFKICRLKIDQSFVRDITTDIEDKTIVAAVISMARNLGIKTLAEGVETAEQLAFLREQGCDEAQGFYSSKPVPPGAIETLFARDEAYRATVPAGTA